MEHTCLSSFYCVLSYDTEALAETVLRTEVIDRMSIAEGVVPTVSPPGVS